MKQTKWFNNYQDLNKWLERNSDLDIVKMYSNGPDYFFVVYEAQQ